MEPENYENSRGVLQENEEMKGRVVVERSAPTLSSTLNIRSKMPAPSGMDSFHYGREGV